MGGPKELASLIGKNKLAEGLGIPLKTDAKR
jgi:hypothetical protein